MAFLIVFGGISDHLRIFAYFRVFSCISVYFRGGMYFPVFLKYFSVFFCILRYFLFRCIAKCISEYFRVFLSIFCVFLSGEKYAYFSRIFMYFFRKYVFFVAIGVWGGLSVSGLHPEEIHENTRENTQKYFQNTDKYIRNTVFPYLLYAVCTADTIR